jgi:hypothetical protein
MFLKDNLKEVTWGKSMGSHESPSGRIGSWRYVGGIPWDTRGIPWDETTICDMGVKTLVPSEPQNSW